VPKELAAVGSGNQPLMYRVGLGGSGMGISFKEETILDLIAGAYDAALDSDRWPAFLETLARALGSAAAYFYQYESDGDGCRLKQVTGFGHPRSRDDLERYAVESPWLQAALQSAEDVVLASHKLISNRRLAGTEFCHDLLQPLNMFYALAAVIRKDGTTISVLELLRSRRAGPFQAASRDFLAKLLPQLRRALSIHEQFATLDLARLAFGDALNCFDVGIILVGPTGRPFHLNRRAESILAERDGLILTSGELGTTCAKETARLRLLVSRALRPDPAGKELGGSMTVARPSMRRPLSTVVAPIRAGGMPISGRAGRRSPAVAIFVSDPEHNVTVPVQDVAHHFGLTHAEAAILLELANGKSLARIAAERRISKNTVRSHLQRIFDKTDTSRQAELVKLVLSGPAAVSVAVELGNN